MTACDSPSATSLSAASQHDIADVADPLIPLGSFVEDAFQASRVCRDAQDEKWVLRQLRRSRAVGEASRLRGPE